MTADQDERAIWLGRYVLPHEGELRGWLQRRAPAGLDVDDIIQETYTRLVAADRIDQIKDPRTYAFQVAKSVILTHIRRTKIVRITAIEHIEEIGVDWVAPEQTVAFRDELERLAEAISGLPEPAGTVFRLRRIHNLSQKEVAAELGLSEGSVEHFMGNALFALRRLFDRHEGSPGPAGEQATKPRRSARRTPGEHG